MGGNAPCFIDIKNITYINIKKLTAKKGVQEALRQCSLTTNGIFIFISSSIGLVYTPVISGQFFV